MVSGHGDEQRLAKQHGAGGRSAMFVVALPEIYRQVHPLTVFLLHLIPEKKKSINKHTLNSDPNDNLTHLILWCTRLTQRCHLSPLFGWGHHPVCKFYGICDCKHQPPPSRKKGRTAILFEEMRKLHIFVPFQPMIEHEWLMVYTWLHFFWCKRVKFSHSLEGFHRVWTRRCTGRPLNPAWGPPPGTARWRIKRGIMISVCEPPC